MQVCIKFTRPETLKSVMFERKKPDITKAIKADL